MTDAAEHYESLKRRYADDAEVAAGQMFGKPCLKINGKAFVAQHLGTVVFKLGGDAHARALAQAGATLWDPSGKGRPMKEWVALPAAANPGFPALADAARAHVAAGA